MNNAINFGNFIDMLLDSDDEYEPYGLSQYALLPIPASAQAGYMMSSAPGDGEDNGTWYGE